MPIVNGRCGAFVSSKAIGKVLALTPIDAIVVLMASASVCGQWHTKNVILHNPRNLFFVIAHAMQLDI
jgi:hypothetical protein